MKKIVEFPRSKSMYDPKWFTCKEESCNTEEYKWVLVDEVPTVFTEALDRVFSYE